jgi:hypothetical protein
MRMISSRSYFKNEAILIAVICFAPFFVALLFFIVVMLVRYLSA